MKSKVFFSDLRASGKVNLLSKIVMLMDSAGLPAVISPRMLVAIKLHFGERGNSSFVRPVFVRAIVDRVKEMGGMPFLTDTNTLYLGTRSESVSHLTTAIENGFAYAVANAPIIIADGMRGGSYSAVEIKKTIIDTAYLGKEIVASDVLIAIAHFKGHELAGFGGAIKNLAMGCASRKGKLDQHSGIAPAIKKKRCVVCEECIRHCSQKAISLVGDKASIDKEKCFGCGECMTVCPSGAIRVRWKTDIPLFLKKMVEYAYAVMQGKTGKALFLNFLTDITPDCDCCDYSDAPIVRDIGILASTDPVAIDQASVDLVNQQVPLGGSRLMDRDMKEDLFRTLYPKVDWSVQFEHAVRIGLGNREYELIMI